MLKKITNVFNKDILKIFSLNAVATLIKMLTSFVSIKVVAVLIGPPGIALLGQLNNFSSIFLSISTGGLNNGITKYVAENADDCKEIKKYLSTSLWIISILSLLTGLTLIVGANYFSVLILHDVKYRLVMFIFGFSISFYALNNYLISIINGFKQFKTFVIVNIVGSILSLIFTIILSISYGIIGALIAAVTFQSVIFAFTIYRCYKCHWFRRENFIGRFDKIAGKKLAHYSYMALVTAVTVPISQLYIRGYLTEKTSLTDAGIWEGMNRISGMYLMVITTSLSIYYLPRLSELKDRTNLRKEIFSLYKMFIPFLIIITTTIYFCRDYIVAILFNNDFKSMTDLFFYQLLGDLFKLSSWILSFVMVAKSMTAHFIITEVTFSITFTLLSVFFINRNGNVGATIAFAVNYFIYLIVMIVIFRKLLFSKKLK